MTHPVQQPSCYTQFYPLGGASSQWEFPAAGTVNVMCLRMRGRDWQENKKRWWTRQSGSRSVHDHEVYAFLMLYTEYYPQNLALQYMFVCYMYVH